jgi:hypothetical protein
MKKILRLVTTSVLTLTLVACGEASSSVSNGTNTSSSVSSTTSAFANVSTITLSAASDVLTQTMGTQKAVVVQAALNANTNPSLALEWFVNGTKSNQTGRVFEYTPAAAGTFEIQAKSGSVLSNKINVTVGAAAFAITGEIKVVDADTIEFTAPGGATVAVTNNEVLDSSYYDLKKGIYVINLKTALKQNTSATLTLTREGNASVSKLFTFDTRKLESAIALGSTALKAEADGSFKITRPHTIVAGANGGENDTVNTYSMSFAATELGSATPVAFQFKTVSVPTGGTKIADSTGQRLVGTAAASSAGQFSFSVDKDTPVGAYKYEYTVNGKVSNVVVNVVAPEQKIEFTTIAGSASVFTLDDKATASPTGQKFNMQFVQTGTTQLTNARVYALVPNAAGQYEVTKDFLQDVDSDKDTLTARTAVYKTISFTLNGSNFGVPTTLVEQTSIEPNQVIVSMTGPNNTTFMRVTSPTPSQSALPTPDAFRADFSGFAVSQYIDASTIPGLYTFSVRVLQLGTEIATQKVEVLVKAPEVKSELFVYNFDAGSSYAESKTARFTALAGAYSFTDLPSLKTDLEAILPADAPASLLTATGIIETEYDALKASVFSASLTQDLADKGVIELVTNETDTLVDTKTYYPPAVDQYNYTNWLAAKVAYTARVKEAFPPYATAGTLPVNLTATEQGYFASASEYDIWVDFVVNEFVNSNLTTLPPYLYDQTAVTSEKLFKAVDGVYVIERPRVSTLDTQTYRFGLEIHNFESATNPAATNANAWTNIDSLKKEFLTLTKTATSPATLENLTFNQVASKVGIELGEANNAGTLIDDLDSVATTKYMYYASLTDSVKLHDLFVLDVTALTTVGDYVFNLQIGSITQQIKVKVIEPQKAITFRLLNSNDGVAPLESDELNASTTIANKFTLNSTDGKYYATLGSKAAGETEKVVAPINIIFNNFVPNASSKLPFTLTRNLAGLTDTITDLTTVAAGTGNDGKHVGVALDTAGFPTTILNLVTRNLGSLNLNATPAIDAAANTNTTVDTTVVGNLDDFRTIDIAKEGEYVFTLTVEGVTSTLTLVVLPYPTVEVSAAKVGTTDLVKTASLFTLEETGVDIKVNFTVAGKSLPTGKVYYKVFDPVLDVVGTLNNTDFYTVAGGATPTAPITKDGIEDDAKSIPNVASANFLKELGTSVEVTYADGIGSTAINTSAAAVAESPTRARKVTKVIALYTAKVNSSTPANLDYTLVGFHELSIWIVDFAENPKE